MKLYIGNLSFNTDEQALESLCSNYGSVSDVAIITDRDTGRSRGFGFVTFDDDAAAQEAIEALNGTEVDGRTLTVNEAKPKENRSGGGGGGYGGGGGRGGRGGGGGRW